MSRGKTFKIKTKTFSKAADPVFNEVSKNKTKTLVEFDLLYEACHGMLGWAHFLRGGRLEE